jgi:hypothetical protein
MPISFSSADSLDFGCQARGLFCSQKVAITKASDLSVFYLTNFDSLKRLTCKGFTALTSCPASYKNLAKA